MVLSSVSTVSVDATAVSPGCATSGENTAVPKVDAELTALEDGVRIDSGFLRLHFDTHDNPLSGYDADVRE